MKRVICNYSEKCGLKWASLSGQGTCLLREPIFNYSNQYIRHRRFCHDYKVEVYTIPYTGDLHD
jgi:hypothetical protein